MFATPKAAPIGGPISQEARPGASCTSSAPETSAALETASAAVDIAKERPDRTPAIEAANAKAEAAISTMPSATRP